MADRLFVNGKIFTGRSEDDFVTAFRVTDGAFSWVGGRLDDTGRPVEQPLDDPPAEVVDLEGRTVLPGLLDVHHHPTYVAAHGPDTCLLPPAAAGIGDVIALLRDNPAAGETPEGETPEGEEPRWIHGWGYDEAGLAEQRPLTRHDLDQVSTTQPVLVRRFCAHSASANSVALRLAGITRDTPDPVGAKFGRDENGEPDGILTEIAAVRAVESVCPPMPVEQLASELVTESEHLASLGIVAVADMAVTLVAGSVDAVRAAMPKGFAQRIGLYLEWTSIADDPPELTDDDRTGRARIAGVKVFMDGIVTNRTAWMTRPFRDTPHVVGGPTCTDDELRAALAWARANSVQVAVHAMGDAAIGHVIDVLGDEEPWLGDTPSVRIEHATILTEELVGRLTDARMSFAVVSHSVFYYAEFESYNQVLTARHLVDAYPLRRLYESVPAAAMSSDCPATAMRDSDNVFTSVQAAVDRRAAGGETLGYDQALTAPQALLLYTSRAARCTTFGEAGEIATGRPADFVVLDRDPFTTPATELGTVQAAETYIGGRKVFQR